MNYSAYKNLQCDFDVYSIYFDVRVQITFYFMLIK